MDSLTQIVLGAAVAELTTGKKLGNRAMVWGAIAGTIPDLDVFVGKLYADPVNELAFHRGISHSFFFAATFSILMAWLTVWLYDKGNYKKKSFANSITALVGISILAVLLKSDFSSVGLIGSAVLAIPTLCYMGYRYIKERSGQPYEDVHLGWKSWYWLFFWSIITHPVLDCFTVYGTQIFLPFSNQRVSFDTISVADPAYTVPFLLCVGVASFFGRTSRYRAVFTTTGLVISSMYMVWTFYNKNKVTKVLEHTLTEQQIAYSRYMTAPTILNNVLWSTTVEADSVFYQGQYSFFDTERTFQLAAIPKNHDLIPDGDGDHTIETLRWFSDDYYGVIRRRDGRLQINDMRYGSFSGTGQDEDDYIFRFVVEKDSSGRYWLDESAGGPPRGREQEIFSKLLSRIQGVNSNGNPKSADDM